MAFSVRNLCSGPLRYMLTLRWCAVVCACMACMCAGAYNEYIFDKVDVGRSIDDRELRSIIQLPDGRMAFVTETAINIYDGAHHVSFPTLGEGRVCDIPGYSGFTHVYVDSDSMLWYKNTGRLSGLDLRREVPLSCGEVAKILDCDSQTDDFFVDSDGGRWVREGCKVTCGAKVIEFGLSDGLLQDIDVDGQNVYLFFSHGNVVAYSPESGERLYESKAYPVSEESLYGNTSLVRRGNDGFYQVRMGARSGLFFFNPNSRGWSKILDTDYSMNTLAVSADGKAFISCHKGLWIINLDTLDKRYVDYVRISGGGALATEISTVFIDADGGIWLGTFNRGILHTHPEKYDYTKIEMPGDVVSDVKCRGGFFENREGDVFLNYGDNVYLLDAKEKTYRKLDSGNIYEHTEYADGNSSFEASDGSEYFMDSDGVSVFRAVKGNVLSRSRWTPVLTGLYIHGEKIEPHADYAGRVVLSGCCSATDRIELDHNQNFVTFEYSLLDYDSMAGRTVNYILEGNDPSPSVVNLEASDRGIVKIHYTNLAPGKYLLRVGADIHDSGICENEASLEVVVRAPWWRTPAAYVIYALATLAIIVAGIWIYTRWTRLRYQRKHREEMLLFRMKGLIEQCERYEAERKEMMKSGISDDECTSANAEDAVDAMSDADKAFLSRAVELVENNLHSSGYSVEQLSRDLCMERTGLYRKLVALLDKSPSLFIRSVRLRRAANLLSENPGISVAEVAELTGFSSSSYLSKCFQEEFGCRPSEYVSSHGKST